MFATNRWEAIRACSVRTFLFQNNLRGACSDSRIRGFLSFKDVVYRIGLPSESIVDSFFMQVLDVYNIEGVVDQLLFARPEIFHHLQRIKCIVLILRRGTTIIVRVVLDANYFGLWHFTIV